MPKLEKALAIALAVSILFSAALLKNNNESCCEHIPVTVCESTLQQWWAVVFPTLQDIPEGNVQLRFRIAELFKNVSCR